MKKCILQLLIFLCAFSVFAKNEAQSNNYEVTSINNYKTAYIPSHYYNVGKTTPNVIRESAEEILHDVEFETIKLEKGRRFTVISEQNLNNNIAYGIPVRFESVQNEYLAYNKKPAKITFHGVVEKTSRPRIIGKSGSIKIQLNKITIDKITYPVEALISKMNNRNVYLSTLTGSPNYWGNLADAANSGVIHSTIKDPCGVDTCNITSLKKPFIFFGAATLQAADLLLSPFVALGKRGNDVDIPLNTYFEIKLDKDLYVLNI